MSRNHRYGSRKPYFIDLNDMINLIFIEAVKRNWSLIRLATEADVMPQTVYNLDDGTTHYPRLHTIWKLCKAVNLGVSIINRKGRMKFKIAG